MGNKRVGCVIFLPKIDEANTDQWEESKTKNHLKLSTLKYPLFNLMERLEALSFS